MGSRRGLISHYRRLARKVKYQDKPGEFRRSILNNDGSLTVTFVDENDLPHRDFGLPAKFTFAWFNFHWTPILLQYFQHGVLHNEHAPAEVDLRIQAKGRLILISERWYHLGLLSRIDGPAEIQYQDDLENAIRSETWLYQGQIHRIDGGPAYTLYRLCATKEPSAVKQISVWWIRNQRCYFPDGSPAEEISGDICGV